MIRRIKFFIVILLTLIIFFKYNFKLNNKNGNLSNFNSNIQGNLMQNDKWIVVTTINNPTEQLIKLGNEKNFKLIVVADLKTNSSWFHTSKTYFLGVSNQNALKYQSLQSTPFNSYTRKNIGYLFAIQHGAKFIYDTDDDNEPLSSLEDYFDFRESKQELEYDLKSPLIINPYAHFGQPTVWPRGYPLNEINKKLYNNYICIEKPTSIIQQSVVDGDPDVDAIFRLTKSLNSQKIDIKFDSSSPSVKIPIFKMTPFNSQNTLYVYFIFNYIIYIALLYCLKSFMML